MFAFEITESVGLPLIFLFVMLETAGVLPMSPGEIAVISGGIEAGNHKLALVSVLVIGAAGAIVGDNIGYVIGRVGGRRLLERRGPFVRQRRRTLEVADPFFERHGGKAVFYGRWLPVLRVFASWFAGGAKMRWRTFFVWNAAGGITWALTMGLLGYLVGATAKSLINDVGTFGLVAIALTIISLVVINRRRHKRGARSLMEVILGTAEGTLAAAETTLTTAEAMVAPAEPQLAAAQPLREQSTLTSAQPATGGQATVASAQPPSAGQATVASPRAASPSQATVIGRRAAPGEGLGQHESSP